MAGKLVIFSAPSGAGKTTIVKRLLHENTGLEFSISACSRAKRPDEKDGVDYYFMSPEEFKKRVANDEFIEWEQVYEGNFYGTLKTEISRISSKGNHVIFDVDVVGGLNIKKLYQEAALAIFIMPPSLEILKARLINRHTDNEESLGKRISKAEKELAFAPEFDRIIINDDLEKAIEEAKQVLTKFLNAT